MHQTWVSFLNAPIGFRRWVTLLFPVLQWVKMRLSGVSILPTVAQGMEIPCPCLYLHAPWPPTRRRKYILKNKVLLASTGTASTAWGRVQALTMMTSSKSFLLGDKVETEEQNGPMVLETRIKWPQFSGREARDGSKPRGADCRH